MTGTVLRRIHMYLALSLAPWIAVYAVSTLAMNHSDWFQPAQPGAQPPWAVERETTFEGVLPEGDARAAAPVLLASLGLDGAHSVSRRADGTLVIQRQDLFEPRRVTYTPASHKLIVEKLPYRTNQFLERLHRRRGFQQPYWQDDAWAFSVDAVILAMVFWVVSGLWLWWELKAARASGAVSLGAGILLFAFYVAVL